MQSQKKNVVNENLDITVKVSYLQKPKPLEHPSAWGAAVLALVIDQVFRTR